jgi:hypothetical protein
LQDVEEVIQRPGFLGGGALELAREALAVEAQVGEGLGVGFERGGDGHGLLDLVGGVGAGVGFAGGGQGEEVGFEATRGDSMGPLG